MHLDGYEPCTTARTMKTPTRPANLLVLSHLRWDFVFQRPQHLLTRCAQYRHVYFLEEPVYERDVVPHIALSPRGDQLHVAVPHLPHGLSDDEINAHLTRLTDDLVRS